MNSAGGQARLDSAVRRLASAIQAVQTRGPSGRLIAVSGTLLKVEAPLAQIGELCELRNPDGGTSMHGEVVAIDNGVAHVAPYGPLAGLSNRTEVIALGRAPSIHLGNDILGQVVDAFGNTLSRFSETSLKVADAQPGWRSLHADPPDALDRAPIEKPFGVGLRAIDGLVTCGEGQRIGIFGPAGAGKSMLVSQIVRAAEADVVVVGLIGERGREVGDFIRRTIRPERRDRTVMVVSTSDRPPIERMQAALTATSIAEYFADLGLRVMLVVDSITRLARALRDVGLSAGEPPTRRGFPPSVFSTLPRLLERSGPRKHGSITAFYTVLVEGEASADPIVEETRSLLDGHIVLSSKLAESAHFPAIDVLDSRSRVMDMVVDKSHVADAKKVRELMAKYRDVELLIQVGEYRRGSDPLADQAVDKHRAILSFLQQGPDEFTPIADTRAGLHRLAG
ncbi:MAG TPA: FliI/YscN family ATPase [Beijerinckiaceae bacterium]|nr:FliI/YscN family ATPase [Beijerinckiaceae bacterium]